MRFDEDLVYFPNGFPRPGANWRDVQLSLYKELVPLQQRKCVSCGQPLRDVLDIHEALVTKGQVQGWPKPWRIIIINKYNCVVIHRSCHEHSDRELVWKHKCGLFGEDEILKWYESLPFRSPPGRIV